MNLENIMPSAGSQTPKTMYKFPFVLNSPNRQIYIESRLMIALRLRGARKSGSVEGDS